MNTTGNVTKYYLGKLHNLVYEKQPEILFLINKNETNE